MRRVNRQRTAIPARTVRAGTRPAGTCCIMGEAAAPNDSGTFALEQKRSTVPGYPSIACTVTNHRTIKHEQSHTGKKDRAITYRIPSGTTDSRLAVPG